MRSVTLHRAYQDALSWVDCSCPRDCARHDRLVLAGLPGWSRCDDCGDAVPDDLKVLGTGLCLACEAAYAEEAA